MFFVMWCEVFVYRVCFYNSFGMSWVFGICEGSEIW